VAASRGVVEFYVSGSSLLSGLGRGERRVKLRASWGEEKGRRSCWCLEEVDYGHVPSSGVVVGVGSETKRLTWKGEVGCVMFKKKKKKNKR